MDDIFVNEHNYVRSEELALVSVESLAIVVTIGYFIWLALGKRASLEAAFFLSVPFSDRIFRAFMVQPSELIGALLILVHLGRLRMTPVIGLAITFIVFSGIGCFTTDLPSWYSLLYSGRFMLTALLFSTLSNSPVVLPKHVIEYSVVATFLWTFLQIGLWTAGLPVDGVFFNGFIPRPKGLAHEPATWAIWILSLLPYVTTYRLRPRFVIMSVASLLATFSTFGFVSTAAYFLIRVAVSPAARRRQQLVWAFAAMMASGIVGAAYLTIYDLPEEALTVVHKLLHYVNEMLSFLGFSTMEIHSTLETSGRGDDFVLLQELLPDHWLLGIGSFNSGQVEVPGIDFIPAANTYITFLVELGVAGLGIAALCLGLHYRSLFKARTPEGTDYVALSAAFLVMIAGIRCFAFHELWYAQANAVRSRHRVPEKLTMRTKALPMNAPRSNHFAGQNHSAARTELQG